MVVTSNHLNAAVHCSSSCQQCMAAGCDVVPTQMWHSSTGSTQALLLHTCAVQDESIHDLLEQLRGKYKTVLAALGKTQQYSAAAAEATVQPQQQQQQRQGSLTY